MNYVDGFLLAVPNANKEAYRQMAQTCAEIFLDHGALAVVEAWGDDVPQGKLNSMHTAVLCEADETVVFSWVTWPDRATRDDGMKRFMEDPRIPKGDMPFDGKRMIFGGFKAIVQV
jgi:uncharacterized protein YbaA (DUF1428 family)